MDLDKLLGKIIAFNIARKRSIPKWRALLNRKSPNPKSIPGCELEDVRWHDMADPQSCNGWIHWEQNSPKWCSEISYKLPILQFNAIGSSASKLLVSRYCISMTRPSRSRPRSTPTLCQLLHSVSPNHAWMDHRRLFHALAKSSSHHCIWLCLLAKSILSRTRAWVLSGDTIHHRWDAFD